MEIFIGIDWGEQHHQVHALDAEGRLRLQLRVGHDRAGLEVLREALTDLGDRYRSGSPSNGGRDCSSSTSSPGVIPSTR